MHLRKTLIPPGQWDEMFITTLFKKKGSWKRLDDYRGIFIVMTSQLIYEKVLKNRIAGVLEANMSKFQNGGVKGKSVSDNLFILREATDHARYLGKEVFITFYDTEKCFDSFWLQDCKNALWDNSRWVSLFHLSFEQKSSYHNQRFTWQTDHFVLHNLVKQGTVLGPVLNNCWLDRIPKEGSGYKVFEVCRWHCWCEPEF